LLDPLALFGFAVSQLANMQRVVYNLCWWPSWSAVVSLAFFPSRRAVTTKALRAGCTNGCTAGCTNQQQEQLLANPSIGTSRALKRDVCDLGREACCCICMRSTLAAVAFLAFAGVFRPAHYVLHKTALCHFAAMHLSRGATRSSMVIRNPPNVIFFASPSSRDRSV
jgi:hypothetical protein